MYCSISVRSSVYRATGLCGLGPLYSGAARGAVLEASAMGFGGRPRATAGIYGEGGLDVMGVNNGDDDDEA